MSNANPKKLADAIWGRAMGSDCSQEDCAAFFADVFRAPHPPVTTPSWLPPQAPHLPLEPLSITPAMVLKAIRKKGAKQSAPGLDGIT